MAEARCRIASVLLVCLVTGCVVPAPEPDPVSKPAPTRPTQAAVSAPSEDGPPTFRVTPTSPKPSAVGSSANKSVPGTSQSAAAAKNGKTVADSKVSVPADSQSAPAPSVPSPAKSKVSSAIPEALLKDYPWLQYCQRCVVFGGAVQCDVDTLLAQPSARVQVYVREPKLARTLPDGLRIQLREGLPRLYRFFVAP